MQGTIIGLIQGDTRSSDFAHIVFLCKAVSCLYTASRELPCYSHSLK